MIHLDFETKSVIDLTKVGAYNYSEHESTDVNCAAYSIGDGEVSLWEPGDPFPSDLLQAVNDGMLIAAWNAAFERHIWNNVFIRYGAPKIPISQFYCVAALARARGFPGKLEKVGPFAELPFRKDMEGHRLMLKLCQPRRIEEDGTIVWWDNRDEYLKLGMYCVRDVEVERAIFDMMVQFSDEEISDYHLSEEINDRGVHVDVELARAAVAGVESEKIDSDDMMKSLTDGAVTSHTQVDKISAWVAENWKPMDSLGKGDIYDALQEPDIPPLVAEVLELRVNNAKSAVAKYAAILNHQCDGLVRGGYIYRGAGQTGRYTSLGVQRHNMLRASRTDTIPILKKHGIPGLKMMGDPVKLLAEMVRPTFVAPPGQKFLIGDFAQIEARVLAWLAGDTELLDDFASGADVYCKFGTVAFGRLITKADVQERFISKGCVLGLGFGGAESALARTLKSQGNLVLPDSDLKHFVKTYRATRPKITSYWKVVSAAVLSAMYSREIIEVGPIQFYYDDTHLWCRLPSGRLMCYPFAQVVEDEYGDSVEYRRGNRSPKAGASEWPTVRMWHGLIVENLSQAVAFDLLQAALRRLRDWNVRLHTHDEIVACADNKGATEKSRKFEKLMTVVPDWADGLPIAVEVMVNARYTK